MSENLKIAKRKAQAYDLLRRINQVMVQAKEWQGELGQLENEINELEEEDAIS